MPDYPNLRPTTTLSRCEGILTRALAQTCSFTPSGTPCPPHIATSNPSEILAVAQLGAAFGRTFSRVRVLSGLVLPLPPGARLPTAEFDCIIVCEAGVYLFEVKGWDRCLVGHDKLEGGANQWYLQQPCGQRHLVADPIVQGIEKMQALKTYLDPRIAVRSYVMLPCGEVQVCPTLPASVLTSQEVDYLPRMCKAATKASKCCQRLDDETVDIVADVIQALSGGLTLAGHIANCQRFELQKKATRATPRPCDALALLLPAAPLAASLVSG